ncbi:hypothetical protein KKG52_02085 [Patescibacteria group bacterium]|nr:hypothetical protein [Patescibacteria group bacterium]
MNKLLICKKTRKIAASALLKVLEEVLSSKKPISEFEFGKKWLKELRKNKDIFPNGWYDPPPSGMAIIFGK